MTKRIALLASVLIALTLALAGCGGSTSTPKMPAGQRLTAAKKALDTTSGVKISLDAKVPKGVSGVTSAEGVGNHQPAFDGQISLLDKSLPITLPVIAVDGKVYVKFGIWTDVDPGKYNAPDPAALMSPDTGLSALLTSATKVSAGDQKREGKTVVTTYSATEPGSLMSKIIPTASPTKEFTATFSLDDQNHLVKSTLTGEFYVGKGNTTYTLTFTDYGTSSTIKKP